MEFDKTMNFKVEREENTKCRSFERSVSIISREGI